MVNEETDRRIDVPTGKLSQLTNKEALIVANEGLLVSG